MDWWIFSMRLLSFDDSCFDASYLWGRLAFGWQVTIGCFPYSMHVFIGKVDIQRGISGFYYIGRPIYTFLAGYILESGPRLEFMHTNIIPYKRIGLDIMIEYRTVLNDFYRAFPEMNHCLTLTQGGVCQFCSNTPYLCETRWFWIQFKKNIIETR